MDESTFQYLKPSEDQMATMAVIRGKTADFAATLDHYIPDGPDKTYLLRKLREVAMWANVAITRHADGSPRV